MTTNLAMIADLSRPGAKSIFGNYATYKDEWSEIYTTHSSDKAWENTIQMKYLPLAVERQEGAGTATADMESRYMTTFYHKVFGLQFIITKIAIEDNLYKDKFPMIMQSLKRSLLATKNTVAMTVLNNAFDPGFPQADGKALISLGHPTDFGLIANGFNSIVDLSEGAIEASATLAERFRDLAGVLCNTKLDKLIVPPALSWTAERLTTSVYRVGTPNNDPSAIYSRGTLPNGYRVNHYLTNDNGYFFLTDTPDTFKHFIRNPIDIDMYTDFSSDNLLTKATERYCFGNDDWRGVVGGGVAAV